MPVFHSESIAVYSLDKEERKSKILETWERKRTKTKCFSS